MRLLVKNNLSNGSKRGRALRDIRKYWYGGKCMWIDPETKQRCKCKKDLELAHIKPTKLSKEKTNFRSSWERLTDVMNNPTYYWLLCPEHHLQFDGRDSFVSRFIREWVSR